MITNNKLEELYQERASSDLHVGNIYKGRVTNVEPSIQAAFIDFGLERNGFLHISDLHPMYFPGADKEEVERVGMKTPRRDRPPIQKCLRRGQDILVQVLKEGISTKGPTLTSYLSIPGRFIVMMPFMERLGVTRKVEDDEARREMRKILDELNPPAGFGFIVRTAGMGRNKTELKRDLAYLQRLWKSIEQRRKNARRVGELYAESDLVVRTIRDVFTTDIERIIVDDPIAAQRASDFLSIANPRAASRVYLYNEPTPIFEKFDIERQIDHISAREVPLPSGGSLVIEQTEALVAIDVNSGKSRENKDAETTAYKTNLEACDEICRQLRLRDLGGVIVNDLIDMRHMRHRRELETRFRNNLKNDRARTRVSTISTFGILEMTRQRMRPSLNTAMVKECDACAGLGHVKSPESVVLDVMRRLAVVLQHPKVDRVELTISPDVAFQLLNRKRSQLTDVERRFKKRVLVRVGGGRIDHLTIDAYDINGNVVTASGKRINQKPELEAVAPTPMSQLDILEDEPADELVESELDETMTDQSASGSSGSADGVDDVHGTNDGDGADADASSGRSRTTGNDDNRDGSGQDKPRRRRRRRGGRKHRRIEGEESSESGYGENDASADAENRDSQTGNADGEYSDGQTRDSNESTSERTDEKSESSNSSDSPETAGRDSVAAFDENGDPIKPKRRRRRGGRRHRRNRDGNHEQDGESGDGSTNGNLDTATESSQSSTSDSGDSEHANNAANSNTSNQVSDGLFEQGDRGDSHNESQDDSHSDSDSEAKPKRRRRRRRRGSGNGSSNRDGNSSSEGSNGNAKSTDQSDHTDAAPIVTSNGYSNKIHAVGDTTPANSPGNIADKKKAGDESSSTSSAKSSASKSVTETDHKNDTENTSA